MNIYILTSLVVLFALLGIECSFIDIVCISDSDCVEHSDCQASPCADDMRMCKCHVGWYPDYIHSKCLKVKHLGESCDANFRCVDPYMACIKGECKCQMSFEPTEDGKACKPSSIPGHVTFAGLGDKCEGTEVVCHQSYEQECKAGKCVCKENFRPLTEEELYSQLDSASKCTPMGKDPELHCPRRIHPDL